VIKNNLDPLPSVNLVYSPLSDMNLRFAWSQTVSRPEFRELSPTQFPAPRGLQARQGNPDLIEANITNWDVRWEWFFSPLELVSLSFFDKSFTNPIEQTVIPESANVVQSWKNAADGTLTGFEFEGRKNFGFLSPRLLPLSLLTNVTYTQSTVHEPKAKKLEIQTTSEHPFQGQAPYIVNAVLEWADPKWGTYRLLYNTAGPVLAYVGNSGLPDIQEEQRNQLDFVMIFGVGPIGPIGIPLTFKISTENLLDSSYLFTQAGHTQREYQKGVKIDLSIGSTFD
jgi:outer membrane receptor protein involved in Fe transport